MNRVHGKHTRRVCAAHALKDNIDTDQIIPSREMKSVSKLGLGEGLFAGWRYHYEGNRENKVLRDDFVLNQDAYTDRYLDPARRSRTSAAAPRVSMPSGHCEISAYASIVSPRVSGVSFATTVREIAFLAIQHLPGQEVAAIVAAVTSRRTRRRQQPDG